MAKLLISIAELTEKFDEIIDELPQKRPDIDPLSLGIIQLIAKNQFIPELILNLGDAMENRVTSSYVKKHPQSEEEAASLFVRESGIRHALFSTLEDLEKEAVFDRIAGMTIEIVQDAMNDALDSVKNFELNPEAFQRWFPPGFEPRGGSRKNHVVAKRRREPRWRNSGGYPDL